MSDDIGASNWSETDASNTATPPSGWPEGMNPSDVNNSARMMMGAIKRSWDRQNPVYTAGGGTTAYTLTPTEALAAYLDGEFWMWRQPSTSAATATMNISGLGAKNIRTFTAGTWTNAAAGALNTGDIVCAFYRSSSGTFDVLFTTSAMSPSIAQTITAVYTYAASLVMSGAALNEAKGADIASASTTDIGAATGNYVDVTGTTTITALGTVQAGVQRKVRFTGALTLTHNSTSLILPEATNITTAAGDVADFVSLGSGNWRCTAYLPAAGIVGSIITTQGDVPYRGASNPARLAAGRSGKVLTTAGAAANPLWTPAGALAFVRFVGSTGAIVGTAFNVSSVTRNSAGNYTVNFSPVLPSANYAVVATPARPVGNSLCDVFVDGGTAPTTSAVVLIGVLMNSGDSTISAGDPTHVSVVVYDAT
jgi:hypothetical protein